MLWRKVKKFTLKLPSWYAFLCLWSERGSSSQKVMKRENALCCFKECHSYTLMINKIKVQNQRWKEKSTKESDEIRRILFFIIISTTNFECILVVKERELFTYCVNVDHSSHGLWQHDSSWQKKFLEVRGRQSRIKRYMTIILSKQASLIKN